ncbi:MAG: alanine:cation symporter family protein [Pseudobutyrivibrio sp.]|nr:alanine:cation symporter family protein [Pseudobutyrivibrio sp.]
MILELLTKIDDVMYYPILIIVMGVAGIIFTIRTRFVQIRLFREACRLVMEKPEDKAHISSFQALMVSTASRVGTGNIVGVSTAICIGGPGAMFWMWLMCIIGAASAFVESTLAQVYKQKDKDGSCYGGPAYYIEQALKAPWLSVIFCVCLIATYAVGFNMLCSYNLQSTFEAYSFYDDNVTPLIIGAIIAVLVGFCVMGGGKKIVKLTEVLVPFMGICYVVVALIVIIVNITNVPAMFVDIFKDAFDFKSIFGGVSGSCLIYGIKRGLYSNEAGVGSAPNASASANVSHPVKQGLVQTVSVYIDTMLLCTATGLMCLSSGVQAGEDVSGIPYVQQAIASVFGNFGPLFITGAMILFAFTTLLGNLYYVDNALIYLHGKKMPSATFMTVFRIICVAVIFIGATLSMDTAWAAADITMGLMTIINLPCCALLYGVVDKVLKDYEAQKKAGKNPEFKSSSIGMNSEELEFWS